MTIIMNLKDNHTGKGNTVRTIMLTEVNADIPMLGPNGPGPETAAASANVTQVNAFLHTENHVRSKSLGCRSSTKSKSWNRNPKPNPNLDSESMQGSSSGKKPDDPHEHKDVIKAIRRSRESKQLKSVGTGTADGGRTSSSPKKRVTLDTDPESNAESMVFLKEAKHSPGDETVSEEEDSEEGGEVGDDDEESEEPGPEGLSLGEGDKRDGDQDTIDTVFGTVFGGDHTAAAADGGTGTDQQARFKMENFLVQNPSFLEEYVLKNVDRCTVQSWLENIPCFKQNDKNSDGTSPETSEEQEKSTTAAETEKTCPTLQLTFDCNGVVKVMKPEDLKTFKEKYGVDLTELETLEPTTLRTQSQCSQQQPKQQQHGNKCRIPQNKQAQFYRSFSHFPQQQQQRQFQSQPCYCQSSGYGQQTLQRTKCSNTNTNVNCNGGNNNGKCGTAGFLPNPNRRSRNQRSRCSKFFNIN